MKTSAERQQAAYDKGFIAGYAGKEMKDCPYSWKRPRTATERLRNHWVDGFDAGGMKRAHEETAKECPRRIVMREHACKDRAQCWEPCGDLGKSAEHVVTASDAGAKPSG